jgi:hypothetical protein
MTNPLHSRRTAKPSQFRSTPRSSSPRCSRALVTSFPHSPLGVFRDLHTLSFFGSQLSRVLSAVCALLRKKPGVHLYPEQKRRACPPKFQRRRAISFISPTYERQPRISFVSPTYAKTGGTHPPKNVGAPTFLIFSLIFRTFLLLSRCEGLAKVRRSFSEGGFPRLFLSLPKFGPKFPRISQYTALTGPLFA